MLTYLATWTLNGEYVPARTEHSAHPSLVPFQNFETADGWIVLGCAKEKFWQRLVEVLDVEELRDNNRFGSFALRGEHRGEVLATVQRRLLDKPTGEWLERLEPAGVPCAPVYTVSEALRDPHVAARALIAETEHPLFGVVRQPASPVRVGPPGNDRGQYRRAPLRNEDMSYVLTDIVGYDAQQIADLTASGAFGPVPTTTT